MKEVMAHLTQCSEGRACLCEFGDNQPHQQPVATAATSGAGIFQQQPQQPKVSKPWHGNINTEMRGHLIQKMLQTIYPPQDASIYNDPLLANLVNYAVRTECGMYEQADDQEQYFYLLAERIYKIQKGFDDKQRVAKARQAAQQAATGGGQPQTSGAGLENQQPTS
jgi:hypothetical protein